ncbi:MAG: hypothetical protein CMJ18_04610 [Phycisphaeraceae bacterium]|nr:hypothetical protein [Phycisphaeraceae bacterium]
MSLPIQRGARFGSPGARRRAQPRGTILLLVLFVMVVLNLVALSFAYRTGIETRGARDRAVRAQLEADARSAVAIALGRLVENTNDFDHRGEPWHLHAPPAEERWQAHWDRRDPSFAADYAVIDEQSKLHVRRAMGISADQLVTLGLRRGQIASLADWMDDNDLVQAEGAEDDHYLGRRRPHRAKNRPVEVLDELMMIRGFDRRDYMGEDADRDRRLDAGEDDGDRSHPLDDADGRLRPGMVDLLTTRGSGRVNVNTAPREVLELLALSPSAIDRILAFRAWDGLSSGPVEDRALRSFEDVEALRGLDAADRAVLEEIAVFRSHHFRVVARSVHAPTGLSSTLEVLVHLADDDPRTLLWRPGI